MVEPYYTCTDETLYYTNIFALPVGGGTSAAAYSSYDLFASSIGLRAQTKKCQYSVYGHPTILTSVSLLTATSTSFGSFPTAPAIGPSPPPRADSPIASQTEFQPSKPTQGISDETLQEKLPDATQVAVPATTTALQGSSWPTKSQPVPNEPVPIQNPNENLEGNTSGKSEVTPILIPEIPVGKGSFSAVPSSATTPRPIPTFGDIEITSNGQNEFIVGSQTRVPGGPAGLSLAPIRIGPSATAVVIGGSTIELVASKPSSGVGAAVFTLPGDRIITASSAATFEYIIDDQTLTPGGSISVLGTKIHLASSASDIIIGSQTVQLHPLAPLPQPIIIGGQTLTAQSDRSDYIIDDQTLTPGRTITVSGTPIYLAPSASEVVVGSQTIKLQPLTPYSHPIIIGGQPLTYQSDRSGYIINGQTLQPGSQAVTIAGTPVILAPSLSVLIVGGSSTIPLITALPTLTIAGKTIVPNSASEYIIDGQTLKPGSPAITVSGTVISLAPSASALVVGGTKTIPLLTPGAASTLQPGLADLILGGFNTPASATSPADVTVTKNASQAILGQSASMRLSLRRLICITIITVVIGICNWV